MNKLRRGDEVVYREEEFVVVAIRFWPFHKYLLKRNTFTDKITLGGQRYKTAWRHKLWVDELPDKAEQLKEGS